MSTIVDEIMDLWTAAGYTWPSVVRQDYEAKVSAGLDPKGLEIHRDALKQQGFATKMLIDMGRKSLIDEAIRRNHP